MEENLRTEENRKNTGKSSVKRETIERDESMTLKYKYLHSFLGVDGYL
jgi:hypothetical protein